MSAWLVAVWAVYVAAQACLLVYCSHRYLTLWRWWRRPRPPEPPVGQAAEWPLVTVQLPVYNERCVVERLIEAVGSLDYPRDRLEIQVLDDSTDETRERAARAVTAARARGVDIHLIHRASRAGYKAGALAAGLASARGDLVAVFDADFVPRRDFLRRAVPRFRDPEVGMVQARWGHLNPGESLLTVAQAAMLDAHLRIEHAARMGAGLFFNFNGTAGVWRRACIESAGGWSHDTLTEDLDLSYRAQLAGWRFVFDPDIECPAELPSEMQALKSQQRRWVKGSVQTARKLLPRVFSSPLPLRVKLEALLHLTGNFGYGLMLIVAIMLLPVLALTPVERFRHVAVLELLVILLGLAPVTMFLVVGRRAAGGSAWRIASDVLAALVLGMGLSVNNTRAVLEGLGSRLGAWERTPKRGDRASRSGSTPYPTENGTEGRTELALAMFFAGIGVFAWTRGHLRAIPFMVLLVVGLGYVGWGSWRAGRSRRVASSR